MGKNNIERNYSIIITPDNIEEMVKKINITILEDIKCNRELYGSTSACIISGALSVYVTSAEWDTCSRAGDLELNFYNGKEIVGFALVSDDMFTKFSVEGVKVCEDGFVDYQDACIVIEDYDED